MSQRRKEILRELGLTPIWRRRGDNALSEPAPSTLTIDQSVPVVNATITATNDREAQISRMDWAQLKAAVAGCTACPLCQSRTQTVFGVGDEQADWLFIGEGPGAKEDEIGEPFVGQAGKLLDNMLRAIQLQRGDRVYITNIVKCRPPNNRNPEPSEAEQCHPYLARQIVLIKPKLIVALGKIAAQNLLHTNESIANLRGKLHYYSDIPLIVTYHPAYLLRALAEKAKAWEDLCFAKATMQSLLTQ
ncbi:uracil-DNA glycosylase family protein [Nitrosomonas sp. Nm33]|uniref:uracil-DNA glycosylase n=1 Tax=Nitrosomonas sp. Nm33 TaxID=133724 RepID=UPI00089B9250|nr:uracil-DNA glycosylase [Nitrosomonas sp. Nm33]SDY27431.1 DNA polymerase [Nitrosomonas sp. Nm33]